MLQTTSGPARGMKNEEGGRAAKARNQRAIVNVVIHLLRTREVEVLLLQSTFSIYPRRRD